MRWPLRYVGQPALLFLPCLLAPKKPGSRAVTLAPGSFQSHAPNSHDARVSNGTTFHYAWPGLPSGSFPQPQGLLGITLWGVGVRWLLFSASTAHKRAGQHHCSVGMDAYQCRATEAMCFLQASTAFRRGTMCLHSPKTALHSLLGQEAPSRVSSGT